MSCVLKEIASIQGLSELLCWLCPHLNNKPAECLDSSDSFWPGWDETGANDDNTQPEIHHGWLDECLVALSPTVDLMVIASRNRLAILTSRWERNEHGEKKSILSVNWKGVISHGQESDEISCVVCLPIISQKQSSSGAPDWISVIVGFKSGFISFYTESGLMLLSQIFEEKPVIDISVRTYVPKNFGACIYSDLSEELVILYPKSVVSIDGFALLQTLKACRNQAAKAAAIGGDCPSVASLGYKKWSLSEQEDVSGCVSSGMVPPHLYDHIILMSNMAGFNQGMAGGVPTTTLLLTVGRVPYFASFSIKEGFAQPFMADFAIHYASKLKKALVSAASGWLFGSKSNQETTKKEKRKIEQPLPIPFRYTLPDKRRVGLSIQLSTSRRLATVTDDFGRVNVIDVQKCCVVRMFKGYRDAECGWVTVWGDLGEAQREVPFLVIHAPRRNLLEVWLPQQGPRVAAFNVPKECRLVYTPHSLLGANTQQGRLLPTTPVVLINSRGTLERISIPFHLALSGKTSRQARDVHLLKSLKIALRNQPADQILCLVKEIKTTAIKIQLLNLIVNSKYLTVDLAKDILTELSGKGKKTEDDEAEGLGDAEPNRTGHESRLLSQQLSRLSQLLLLYSFVSTLHSQPPPLPPPPPPHDGINGEKIKVRLSTFLKLSNKELDELLKNLSDQKLQPAKIKKVTFHQDKFSFSKFLQCWEVTVGIVEKEVKEIVPIVIKKKLAEEDETELGRFIFGWAYNPDQVRSFSECLKLAGVNETELLRLSFVYWMSLQEIDGLATLHFFYHLLILAVFSQPHLISADLSEVKPLWEMVREKLICWNKPLHAFVAAHICRGIESSTVIHAHKIGQELDKSEEAAAPAAPSPLVILNKLLHILDNPSQESNSSLDPSEVWEEFSLEVVEWNLLLKKLEKLVSLQRFYNVVTQREGAKNPMEPPEYSIKVLTLKGKGYLSELIARYLIESKLPVQKVINTIKNIGEEAAENDENDENDEENEKEISENISESETCDDEFSIIEEQFRGLRRHFPESTKSDVVLVNLSWEFAAAWKKSPNNLSYYADSVQALKNISNAFFKHGVSCMMWETWVGHYAQSTAQLMEKISRRPKDRVILREIGISEFNLEKFFSLTKELLENMMAGSVACEVERPPIVGKDNFWKDIDTATSLAEVTVAQKITSCDLTFLHHQLICVLNLIVKYELKNVKPFSLFPERDRAAFFKPLISSWRVTSVEGREVVSSGQLSFLTRVVSAAVINLPDPQNDSDLETPSGLYDSIEIGRSWGVSLDAIRRHYVCELYSSGLDAMAEQALIMVRDGVMIASQMVVIAGQRLRHLVTSSPKSIEIIALITPNVNEWCKSLESGNLRCPDVPLRQTLKMVNKALLLIPESSREYKVALNMARSLDMIHNANLFNTSRS